MKTCFIGICRILCQFLCICVVVDFAVIMGSLMMVFRSSILLADQHVASRVVMDSAHCMSSFLVNLLNTLGDYDSHCECANRYSVNPT